MEVHAILTRFNYAISVIFLIYLLYLPNLTGCLQATVGIRVMNSVVTWASSQFKRGIRRVRVQTCQREDIQKEGRQAVTDSFLRSLNVTLGLDPKQLWHREAYVPCGATDLMPSSSEGGREDKNNSLTESNYIHTKAICTGQVYWASLNPGSCSFQLHIYLRKGKIAYMIW